MAGQPPSEKSRGAVLVVGAGISGLTSALCLRRRGFNVGVVAEQFAPRVTSVVAGALWEWPPAICGGDQDPEILRRAKTWAEASYQHFVELARDPMAGIFLRPVNFYFKQPIAENPAVWQKMTEVAEKVTGFRHDAALIAENGINPLLGFRDAYAHIAPMIDTDLYLRWLIGRVRQAGCRVTEGRIAGSLIEAGRRYKADVVVNCTGLGAAELTGDDMFPVRGALVRVRNDGRATPRVTQAHCVTSPGIEGESRFIFIVPRGDDMLVLGGIAEANEVDLDIGLNNYEPIRAMYRRCLEFLPALEGAAIDGSEPVRVGLRPFRRQHVRVESDERERIVHNYGHGGSGVTLSWGCALEVADRVEQMLQ